MSVNSKARGFVCGESGQTLVLALIVMAALTITTAGVVTYMTSNETSFGRDRQVQRSLNGAEAGLSNALSQIVQNDANNTQSSLTPPSATTIGGAGVSYTLAKTTDSTGSYWTVTSTGTYRGVTRIVQQTIRYVPGVSIDESAAYQYGLFIGAPSGSSPSCLLTTGGDVTVSTNVYIGGNYCINGNVHLKPPVTGTLGVYIKGYLDAKGQASVGTNALKFAQALIQGGCSSSNFVICSTATNVYANSYTGTFPTVAKPVVDAAAVYAKASSWVGKCTGGFTLDGNTTRDQSVSSQSLFGGSSYVCTVPKTDGTTATMSWNSATSTFSITGSIFIDGNISLGGSANWTGNGSVFVNGTISKGSNISVCGPPKSGAGATGYGCSTTWDSASISRQGTVTSATNVVSGLSATSDLSVGMYVEGAGIPTGTKIASITNSSTIVLTALATASGTPTLRFSKGNFGLVAINPAAAANGFDSSGNGELDLDVFVNGCYNNTGGTVTTGSIMADCGKINGSAGVLTPMYPPPDFPTTITSAAIGWSASPGGWKELK